MHQYFILPLKKNPTLDKKPPPTSSNNLYKKKINKKKHLTCDT